jgi:hypothetical protein
MTDLIFVSKSSIVCFGKSFRYFSPLGAHLRAHFFRLTRDRREGQGRHDNED